MKSMTGFGTAEGKVGKGDLFVEIKSINHRFCDITVKLPHKMGALEGEVRRFIQERFSRGKIEVYFREKISLLGGVKLHIDLELAQAYHQAMRKLRTKLRISGKEEFFRPVDMERFIIPLEPEGSYTLFWNRIERLLAKAARQVEQMRTLEGRHLAKDQLLRLKNITALTVKIRKRSLSLEEKNKEKQNPLVGVNTKQDIMEELIRLESHVQQYMKLVRAGGSLGRKLDFLLQEMNREMNTIGSKALDSSISRHVVDCKTELERLREQVQNVE